MKKLDEVKELIRNASAIRNFLNATLQKYKSDTRIDKLEYGFNQDKRFATCNGVTITFDSLVGSYGSSSCSTIDGIFVDDEYSFGSYGSSSCSTIVNLSSDVFNKHLLKYLNNNKHTIMLAIADSIEKDAKSIKDEAEKELQAELDKLKKL
ncbi:hypothetical protein [Dysgonomonas sp. 37-18]|uniref:hypothetical protein n=1 Tax=Dysgonomonas sp. 37-18 TaxID=1895907 RepID=UPI00092B3E7D|nr:hypothetical protein [Dysgonomonas sp. 37-18]OJX63048.1 MAG: hypothetical protein BGO84_14180 [Dysgonomonas sp. 37-18]